MLRVRTTARQSLASCPCVTPVKRRLCHSMTSNFSQDIPKLPWLWRTTGTMSQKLSHLPNESRHIPCCACSRMACGWTRCAPRPRMYVPCCPIHQAIPSDQNRVPSHVDISSAKTTEDPLLATMLRRADESCLRAAANARQSSTATPSTVHNHLIRRRRRARQQKATSTGMSSWT